MTNQEAFDKMVQHMIDQKWKQSYTPDKGCLYRHPHGLKCAVGALIPDDEYQDIWDKKNLPANKIKSHCPSIRDLNMSLLTEMQALHDNLHGYNSVRIYEHLEVIANTHELELTKTYEEIKVSYES